MAIYGTNDGKKIFHIPVEWKVAERLHIRANSLEEAIEFVQENMDEIPLGYEPDYLDGSYQISVDGIDTKSIAEQIITFYGYDSSCDAQEYDDVTLLYKQKNDMKTDLSEERE